MNFYALFYDVVDDFISRRALYREEHLRLVREANRRGDLLMAGALGEPARRALLIFRVREQSVAEDFARKDPYVVNELVTEWEVHPWANVIDFEVTAPVQPTPSSHKCYYVHQRVLAKGVKKMAKDTSTKLKPVSEKNLAGYGLSPIAWERALERLEEEWKQQAPPEMGGDASPHTHWLATTRSDGRPHVVPIGVVWHDGHFYFSSGDGTRKSRNLAQNPYCVITLAAKDLDIVLEGEATKVKDDAELHRLAEVFATGGWAPTVRDGAFYHEFSAPSAGPPPWYVYEFTPKTVFGLATAEPYGATRWRL